jgi:hypothetical protein
MKRGAIVTSRLVPFVDLALDVRELLLHVAGASRTPWL